MASILDGLTPAERDVLRLLATGLTNTEISEQRGSGPPRVARHATNIFAKLGVRNRVEAALAYVRATQGIDAPAAVTRIVHQPIKVAAPACPACATRGLAVTARNAGLRVLAISDHGVRVATPRVPNGVLLHDEQDLTDLCIELAEAA